MTDKPMVARDLAPRQRSRAEARAYLGDLGVPDNVAMAMLNRIGISGIANLDELALCGYGCSAKQARVVRACFDLARYAVGEERGVLGRAAHVYALVRPMIAFEEQENFVVIGVDIRNQLLGVERVAVGTAGAVDVHPRDIFRAAVRMNAVGIILAHNHPSGDPSPSDDDIELTKRAKSAGELLGIPVIDHLVIARSGFRSIAEDWPDGI